MPRIAQPSDWGLAACALVFALGCRQPSMPGAPAQEPSTGMREVSGQGAADQLESASVREAVASPSRTEFGAAVDAAADAGPAAAADAGASSVTGPAEPSSKEPHRGDCKALRARVEGVLQRAARCDAHADCAMVSFHWAFGVCGIALRRDAALAALGEEAARYGARCNPPQVVVRCAYKTGALCTRHRCALAAPEELEAADVQPVRIGF